MFRNGWRALGALIFAVMAPAAQAATAVAPAFQIVVSVSPKAAARLAHPKETIKVWAQFYGDGNGKAKKLQDEMGQIAFAPDRTVEISGPGVANFPSFTYNQALVADVDKNGLQVLINVISGRHSSADNLLDCDIFQDKISLAAAKPVALRCKLIGEP